MKRTLLAVAMLAAMTSAFAQVPDATSTDNAATADSATAASAVAVLPPDVGSKLSAADYQAAQQLGENLAQQALGNLNSPQGQQFQKLAAPMARQADDIADASVAKDRDNVLKFLGMNPKAPSGLYYMVSWSMPLEMLRSYVAEAMWDGGILVFRGIPDGMDLNTYIHSNMSQLVYGKGASAIISIDPRLFEAYDVQTVPTIVLTTERHQLNCELADKTIVLEGVPHTYKTCSPLDPKKYWKMEGAVTSDFALREFEKAGSQDATTYLAALAKAGGGEMAPKEQQPFTGNWKDAISPEDVKAVQDAISRAQSIPQQSGASLSSSLQNAAAAAAK
jgi:type-F conjugative transfer system pilin assembly protein TrbC